ncbi:Smr/MutS family protein [Lewinella sp. 4G2]|uniref:Smr/MutS family protein n=1 Tax=Lewinella sp. 4G2 TaxID=1803372 RepID=UPI0007B4EAB1|nr:Smr/MutS family protein [Lewinella sp. 4G2]OAV45401.1 hypothetical protein A3850_013260 [Lewinella sp. 4G2]
MNFEVDQRVRMKRTENVGTVTLVLPGNLVQVKLDGGLGHIPIPAEALELVSPPKPKPAPPVVVQRTVSKAVLHEENGVQLAFDPQLNNEAEPVAYEVYLLNSTSHKIIFELKALTGSNQRWSKSSILEPNSKKRLEAIEYRWLNEKLSLELDVRTVNVGGTGPRHFEKVRVKPSQFFGKYVDVPELYREAHLYPVFSRLDSTNTAPAAAPPNTGSLKELTRKHLASKPKPQPKKQLTQTDIRERLEFSETLDLHLTALVEDPAAVPKHEVLQLQLKEYDEYLDRALRLGVDSVFIIHGVGNGVLKRAIHSRLHRTKFIREFKNEFHPKYGFGATEIIFD